MKAKKKPINTKTAEELGVDCSQRIEVVSLEDPPERSAGISVENVTILMGKLKEEAGVF